MNKRRLTAGRVEPYLYILPGLIFIIIFLFLPMFNSIRYSFTNWNPLKEVKFTGLSNYVKLFGNADFLTSLRVTFIWVIMSVVILPITGLICAVLVEYASSSRRVSGVMRTVLFMPMMMSFVAIGLLWQMIYEPNLGLLNSLLSKLGLINPARPIEYLSNPDLALYWTFVPAIWQWSGFGMIMTSAAMMNIPSDIMEAASIDGAAKWQAFFRVVLPLLMPTVLTGAAINLIGGFKAFDIIYVMTQGGPGSATRVTSILMYRTAFRENKYGYACAMAVVIFAISVVLTVAFNKVRRRVDISVGNF